MLRSKKFVWLLIVIVVSIMSFQGNLLAQKKCMFISETADPYAQDVILVDWLEQTYTVDIATGDDVSTHWYTIDDFKQYDFIFVSETINSSDTKDLKGAPVPIFYTELWSSKWDVTGWVPTNASGTYYENSPEKVVKIINGDHPLAAGFATGTEITIATDTEDASGSVLVYSVPQVDHIPIAVLAADETRVVVMGVEKGTALYNAQNVKDGSLVSESRCAAVGINANANNFLTEDAFKLIDAGIKWILGEGTSVKQDGEIAPVDFNLTQNYPNPFNPTTEISFSLAKPGYTRLTVHNVLGQVVARLVDQDMSVGTYRVTFDATDLPSGIYFYQIKSGEFTQVKKMTLMK